MGGVSAWRYGESDIVSRGSEVSKNMKLKGRKKKIKLLEAVNKYIRVSSAMEQKCMLWLYAHNLEYWAEMFKFLIFFLS